jgi:hypothetical protein
VFPFDLDSAEGNQQLQFSDHSHSTLIFNAMPMSYIRCVKHSVAKQMVIRTAKRSATAATALRCSPSSLAVAALEDDVLRPVVAGSRGSPCSPKAVDGNIGLIGEGLLWGASPHRQPSANSGHSRLPCLFGPPGAFAS